MGAIRIITQKFFVIALVIFFNGFVYVDYFVNRQVIKNMIRRYNLSEGDNAPAYARLTIYGIYGSGSIHIDIGWRPTAVQVASARQFLRVWQGNYLVYNSYSYSYSYSYPYSYSYSYPYSYSYEVTSYDEWSDGDEFQVYVRAQNPFTDTGWWLEYRNAPGLLDINYIVI